jgi:rhamnosyl/mannosyltransferase
MACGIPVVSTDLPTGVPYVNQHGETGLVVPPGDDLALAAAIDDLLSDTTRRLRMGEAALRRAHAEFSAEVMGKKLMKVYKRSIKDKGPCDSQKRSVKELDPGR